MVNAVTGTGTNMVNAGVFEGGGSSGGEAFDQSATDKLVPEGSGLLPRRQYGS